LIAAAMAISSGVKNKSTELATATSNMRLANERPGSFGTARAARPTCPAAGRRCVRAVGWKKIGRASRLVVVSSRGNDAEADNAISWLHQLRRQFLAPERFALPGSDKLATLVRLPRAAGYEDVRCVVDRLLFIFFENYAAKDCEYRQNKRQPAMRPQID
jgi:hypothetical protein